MDVILLRQTFYKRKRVIDALALEPGAGSNAIASCRPPPRDGGQKPTVPVAFWGTIN
jgi:hypothetical protein